MKSFKQFLAWVTGINILTKYIDVKVSEIKQAVADAEAKTAEALGEIGKKIGDMQKTIDDLIAGNTDPDVNDADFAATLGRLKDQAAALAEIVPNPEPPPAEPPTGEPPANPVV